MDLHSILSKLVSFDTFGGDSNLNIAAWIEEYINSHGVECRRVPNEDLSKHSLHCRIGPKVDGGVVLSGHMDVVPVEGQQWTKNPFQLSAPMDGKLYARGSCDMKGFLACCLYMLPKMVQADLKKPIYFAFSYDEEIGCLAGPELAADVMNYYDETPRYAWIGEPTMMQPMLGQKGIVIIEVKLNGSAGHSSRIRSEVSAIHEAARLILWLENKMNDLIKSGHTDARFDPPHTSIHVGMMDRSGIAPNVISDSARFTCDIRVIPQDRSKNIINEFIEVCKNREKELQQRFSDFRIEINYIHSDVPPLDTEYSSPVIEGIKQWIGRDDFSGVSYAAEAGQFSEAGFEAFICGPGDIAQAHRADEFVSVVQLDTCCGALQNLIDDYSSQNPK